jgi:AcrR family transcriptional regulator
MKRLNVVQRIEQCSMSREVRQRQARDATRRAILDAALELFVAEGYTQVSLRNIAAKVEYSPGAIYSYFSSKDDIFLALAEEGFRLLGATHLARPDTPNPVDDLAATAWQLYEFSERHPQYFALVFLDRRVPRIGREYERFAFMADIKSRLLARVQRCIDEGFFPASLHPGTALRLLWAPVLGITSMRLSNRLAPDEDADALVHDAINTTIAGLRAGAATHAVAPLGCDSPLISPAKESSSHGPFPSALAALDPGSAGDRLRGRRQP